MKSPNARIGSKSPTIHKKLQPVDSEQKLSNQESCKNIENSSCPSKKTIKTLETSFHEETERLRKSCTVASERREEIKGLLPLL